ncbi:porphobilinogen synthase [Mahella sp.]|uniref:porphobilinogen synthase n=1 Tax=Mahella sp. TaxID=2798721 RepID=UPI0025BBED7C|nr:porphobilinogen synthase [Mahella sp.]MBZ4666727.1 porphobilinogen synthase [Mahella sp.]
MELTKRPRRLRTDAGIRNLVRETRISKKALIYPLFVKEGSNLIEDIPSLEGQKRCSPDQLPRLVEPIIKAGIGSILLFGLPKEKDEVGSSAWDGNGVVQQAVRVLKKEYPQLKVVTDVCLCEYTSHGHCGVLNGQTVDNDKTLELLAKTALSHAYAGADIVAPSDMMDGRVRAIRQALDANGFTERAIMAYSVKYASSFYGPFRDAAGSAPGFGDRKGYQMDYHNSREAIKEATLDVEEGADILMVKPALSYLDIISKIRAAFPLPLAAYSVSGEYAMIKAAARAGLIDEAGVVCESAVGVFRASADILITYYAPQLAEWIDEGRIG